MIEEYTIVMHKCRECEEVLPHVVENDFFEMIGDELAYFKYMKCTKCGILWTVNFPCPDNWSNNSFALSVELI